MTDLKTAWIEMRDSSPNGSFSMTTHRFVNEGQSFDDMQIKDAHVHIEILQIDFTNGLIKAKEDGKGVVYGFKRSDKTEWLPTQTTVRFDAVGFGDILNLYANIIGRTLLVHPGANQSPFPVLIQARDKAEAARALENTLREKGIATVPDGDKFELIVPMALAKTMRPNSGIPSPSKTDTTIPAGNINFENVPLQQVLVIYEALAGQKLIQDEFLPPVAITFRTQTQLTKTEVIHALDTLFAWHGIKVVNIDDKTFKVVPVSHKE